MTHYIGLSEREYLENLDYVLRRVRVLVEFMTAQHAEREALQRERIGRTVGGEHRHRPASD